MPMPDFDRQFDLQDARANQDRRPPAEAPDALWVNGEYGDLNDLPDSVLEPIPDEPKIEYVTGYPFMQLAKRHGVDYGDVLMATGTTDPIDPAHRYTCEAINRLSCNACRDLDHLLSQPVVLRGDPVEVCRDGSRRVIDVEWLRVHGYHV